MQNKIPDGKKRQAKWSKFNATHQDSWETVLIDGVQKIHWRCSCGSEKILPCNSGFIVGVKVTWRNHFDEVISTL